MVKESQKVQEKEYEDFLQNLQSLRMNSTDSERQHQAYGSNVLNSFESQRNREKDRTKLDISPLSKSVDEKEAGNQKKGDGKSHFH